MSNLKNPPKPERHEHPSYGMLSIGRSMSTHATRLFGSSLKSHHGTIRLTVSPGYMQHELNHDWYHATAATLFEIELSAAQFAEASRRSTQARRRARSASTTGKTSKTRPISKPRSSASRIGSATTSKT